MFPQGACIAKKMLRETLRRGRNTLARKISYRTAQFIIAVATFMAMPQMTFAGATDDGKKILDNIIDKVFGPLGKIVGGFMVVGGIFKYLMAQKDEDARGQHGAIMAIAVGALLFGASTILSSANVSNLVTG
jgi:type IV secretory pathway VirB2 component (pilin)